MTAFSSKKKGALPAQRILQMMKAGFIEGAQKGNVKPSSLDLSLSDEIYEVEGIFQPRQGETVRNVLSNISKTRFSMNDHLEIGQMYLARLNEKMKLPESVYAFCNPKSTTGRNDVHVRILADGVSRYDSLPPGWKGEIWISIVPKSFRIKLEKNLAFNQVRFFNQDTRLDELDLEIAMSQHHLIWDAQEGKPFGFKDLVSNDRDGSILLSIDLGGDIVGYEAAANAPILDLSKNHAHDPKLFFKPVKKHGGYLYLKKNSFYILSSTEAVRVPPDLACEMASMDERSGDFRSHYAGFIDPGWGWGKKGEGKGRPLTLEVRPFEDLIVRHNQPIAKIRFERLSELPDTSYDSIGSNYTVQTGPKLSRHFKEWKGK